MTSIDATDLPTPPGRKPSPTGLGRLLRGRHALILLGVLALGLGAAFNWSWLVAAGVAPLLLSALPCVAMCALGLCMSRMSGRSKGETSPIETSEAAKPDGPAKAGGLCCSPVSDNPSR